MSAADDAYAAAERLIAEAKADGRTQVSFDQDEFRALDRVPPEIVGLTKVREIDLDNTQVSDLTPLSGLTGITSLRLANTQVSDLTPLSGLTGITDLLLNYTQVSDLTPLSGLTGITDLFLNNTQVSDLTPLSGLTGITRLLLNDTQVSDLTPLSGLTGITDLFLHNTQVNDLTPLSGLTGIMHLWLDNTQVSDLTPLSGLTGITDLFLNNTQVSDLTPLSGLTGITRLLLNNTQVSDLTPLSGLTGITDLFLNNTQVSDLTPLSGLTGITRLWLNNTQVSDLTPLSGLTGITDLWLDNTQVSDLRPIRGLRTLVDDPDLNGLTFKGSVATQIAPRIAEIAEIEDDAKRARVLFEYLEDWVPPMASSPRLDMKAAPNPFIFLSYKRQDLQTVGNFRTLFQQQGLSVWLDQDILGGAEWRREITTRLDAAHVVLTFWTADSVASKAVIEEAARAQAAGKLVHVRLDDAQLPYGFAETQYIDMRGWDGTVAHPLMQKLLLALRDKLEPPDAARVIARLAAASPVAMLPYGGVLLPVDTPPHVRPEIENAPDLAARIEGLRQTLGPLQDKAADRDNYQFPTDLRHALLGVAKALNAETLSWYGIDEARASLCDCMEEHDAPGAWGAVMVRSLDRLVGGMAALRPLLQPRQVPAGEPGAKPPETDPVIRKADVQGVQAIAAEIAEAVAAADEALSPGAIDLVQNEVDQIKDAAQTYDEGRKFNRLRRAARGLTYLTGSILVGVSAGIGANLLTSAEAAMTLAQKLQPLFERLIQFFLS